MSAEEAIKSTEPNVVKGAHSSVKGKISSAVAVINALVKDTAGDFNHSKISRTYPLATHSKLMANLELVKGLHEIYCIHREKGKDDTLEEPLL